MSAALICVDVQYDFLPGGALPVPNGDEVVEPLIAAMRDVDYVVLSRDWHPEDHCSFNLWPRHCVQWTHGAEIESRLYTAALHRPGCVVFKGTDPNTEAYSAFDGRSWTMQNRSLVDILDERHVDELVVGGLAGDVCVKATIKDALKLGFDTSILLAGTRFLADPVSLV